MPALRLFKTLLSMTLLPVLSHAQSTLKKSSIGDSLTEEPSFEMPEVVIEGKAESLIGIATSASKGQTNAKELLARPF